MPDKKIDIEKMTDEELLEAAKKGELGAIDGSDPTQREDPDAEPEEKDDEEEEEEADDPTPVKKDDEEDDEEEEEDDESIKVGDKTYTKDEYEALMAALEQRGNSVPQSRLMEEATRRRDAEKRAHDLEIEKARYEGFAAAQQKAEEAARKAAEAAKPKFDLKAKRVEYLKAIDEQRLDDAARIDDEIETERERVSEAKIKSATAEAERVTREEVNRIEQRRLIDNVCAQLYVNYPFLNNKAKDADETAILATIALRNNLIQEGRSPVDAVQEAMTRIGDIHLKKNPPKVVDADAKRRADALRKAIKTNGKQPPKGGGIGNRSDSAILTEKQLRKMSDEQFAKLTDEELAAIDGRSRGQRVRG